MRAALGVRLEKIALLCFMGFDTKPARAAAQIFQSVGFIHPMPR